MTKMLALTVAVAAIMAAVSAADAAECGIGYTTLGHGGQCFAQLAQASYLDDEDDDDEDFDDEDDDEDEYSSRSIIVEDIEDCEPGKFRMVELGDIEVPVACR